MPLGGKAKMQVGKKNAEFASDWQILFHSRLFLPEGEIAPLETRTWRL